MREKKKVIRKEQCFREESKLLKHKDIKIMEWQTQNRNVTLACLMAQR